MRKENLAFKYPFARNGCVPVAFAHAARVGAKEAVAFANKGKTNGLYTWAGRADARTLSQFDAWCRYTGVLTRTGIVVPRITLKRFATTYKQGTWIVFTSGHALAVLDGVPYGVYREHSVVQLAYSVRYAK